MFLWHRVYSKPRIASYPVQGLGIITESTLGVEFF